MRTQYNKKNIARARNLRKNMTKEERHLWYDFLSSYSIRFTKQKVVGRYIVDFYCGQAKLAIELDGSQHYSEEGGAYDKIRTEFLGQYGITVLRIANNQVTQNFEGVCRYIDSVVSKTIGRRVLW